MNIYSEDKMYENYSSEVERMQKCIDELQQENQSLKKQLEYLRSGEYYNQLRFERDMLQYVVDNGKVSKEDKTFIDMTHRNTELLEVIEEVREYIKTHQRKDEFLNLNEWQTRDLLQILDKAMEN